MLPNDISWIGGLIETWDNIKDSLVNELFAIFVVGVSVESVLLIVEEGLIESIIGVESDEGGDWSCEKIVLIIIDWDFTFAVFGHDQLVNLFILDFHIVPIAVSDS